MTTTSFRVVIPARYQSTRLPGKPLADILGKPMVQWVYEAALRSAASSVVIATDEQKIVDAVRAFGGAVTMTSPDHVSGTDRLAEVAQREGWSADDVIVNVQGDEPAIDPELIDQVGALLARHPVAGVATLCTPIHHETEMLDPNAVKVVYGDDALAMYFSRAAIPWNRDGSAVDPLGHRHLGIYGYRVAALQRFTTWPVGRLEAIEKLEQLRFMEQGVRIAIEPAKTVPFPGVDTPADLHRITELLRNRVREGGR